MNKFQKIKCLFHTNLIKTLYVNLKLLPLKQALRFPILLYGDVYVRMGRGANVAFYNGGGGFADVLIGNSYSVVFGQKTHFETTTFICDGTLELYGKHQAIGNGCNLLIAKGAVLRLGNNVGINNRTKVLCQQEINIGNWFNCSWECQICDTNFHYIMDSDGVVHRKSAAVDIGKNCWLGNRVTIQKGVILPDNSVVASNSLVNKDFSHYPNSIIGGIPAKLLSKGYSRVRNKIMEIKIDSIFEKSPNLIKIDVNKEVCTF